MGNLLGRAGECAQLDRLLAEVIEGASRVLILRGDAGVGKSVLLEHLTGRVGDGWRVVTAVGVESEIKLDYGGLHQICVPVLDSIERLPAPQRDALAVVFGLSARPAPDRFLVALATLTLLADAAEGQPLICVVDDAQWLDEASAEVIAFVARRLHAERIALVCAARSGIGDDILVGLPSLSLSGLDDSDARTLLLSNLNGPVDARVCDRIIAESHGNPLALLELPRTWSTADLAGGFGLPDGRAVADKIEQSYVQRLQLLPTETRLIMLAAAAEPIGDRGLLLRAVETLGLDPASVNPAEDANLLRVNGRVEFAHPLVRSATYLAATSADRRRVHQALADATDAISDPDRRAWHRSRAVPGLDEDVAAELQRSADRARSRGGLAAAAAFLSRATELTPSPKERSGRAIEAAIAHVQAGSFDNARSLATLASEGPIDDLQRARVDRLLAQLAFASRRGNEATPVLLAAAQRLEVFDVHLARETYLDAFVAALFGGRLNDRVGLREVAAGARAVLGNHDGQLTVADLLLDAFVALADDYDAAAPLCQAALHKLASDEFTQEHELRWVWLGAVIAFEVWDDESAVILSNRNVQIARESGALSELELALNTCSDVLVLCGDLPGAASMVAESHSVQEATGISAAPYGEVMLTAWAGRADEAGELVEAVTTQAGSRGEGVGIGICEYARAVLCNSLGHYEDGWRAAQATTEFRELVVENWGLPELIEAGVRTGRDELAADAVGRLATKAQASGTNWALGLEARSRALLSSGDRADELFREAISRLGQSRARPDLARAHLLYGEWLRREGRRTDARDQLHTAHDMFSGLGLLAFAERAQRELSATGATARKRSVETRNDLTAQETEIASLARAGLSNPEIATRLFVSPRTVEWHLSNVFTKLGISRRGQLNTALKPHRRTAPAS